MLGFRPNLFTQVLAFLYRQALYPLLYIDCDDLSQKERRISMPKENKNKTKDAKSLMDDFIKLKKTENRTEQQEKMFQETLSKMAERKSRPAG